LRSKNYNCLLLHPLAVNTLLPAMTVKNSIPKGFGIEFFELESKLVLLSLYPRELLKSSKE
jgi:hypothetical protein